MNEKIKSQYNSLHNEKEGVDEVDDFIPNLLRLKLR